MAQLNEYFAGKRRDFTFRMNPSGTEFQQKVWKSLLEIPYGKTVSYMEQTKKLGDVKAIRAVASANGRNPLWIAVPCHRVVGADGSLTGYAGGLVAQEMAARARKPVAAAKPFLRQNTKFEIIRFFIHLRGFYVN